MNQSIQPPAPPSPIISIQPVVVSQPGREGATTGSPLAGLTSGTIIEGFVINRDAGGNPILRTPLGDLQVKSEVFLKTGSEVVFKVDTTQASLARIVTVDGLTLEAYSTQAARGIKQDTISATSLQSTIGNPAATATGKEALPPANPVLPAILLPVAKVPSQVANILAQTQGAPPPVLAQLAQLRVGTPLKLTVFDIILPPQSSPGAVADAPDTATPQPATALPGKVGTAQAAPSPTLHSAAKADGQPCPAPMAAALGTPIAAVEASAVDAPEALVTIAPALRQGVTEARSAATQTKMESALPDAAARPTVTGGQAPATQADTPDTPTASPAPASQSVTPAKPASVTATPSLPAPSGVAANPSQPATAPTLQATVSIPANAVQAQVIGHEADGATILQTATVTLKAYSAQPLPPGTSLAIGIDTSTDADPVPAAMAPFIAEDKMLRELTRGWPSLGEAMDLLKPTSPELIRDVLQRLPSGHDKLASGLLFFIAAVKGGDISELLGRRLTRQLESLAPALLTRLGQDMAQMQQGYLDSPLSHWSAITIPILFGQEILESRLYIGRDPESGKPTEAVEKKGQRFVLEVGMSQLGPMQFDGFVRQVDRNRSFDLIVRTAQALEPDVIHGIRDIYNNAQEVTGTKGQLQFQHGAQHFVQPLADIRHASPGNGPNTILA